MTYLWLVLVLVFGIGISKIETKHITTQYEPESAIPHKSDFRKKDLRRFRKIAGNPPAPPEEHAGPEEKDHHPDTCYDRKKFCWFWRIFIQCNGVWYESMLYNCRRTCYFC